MRCSNGFIGANVSEVTGWNALRGEAGAADGSQQLGRKIRNASAIYVETQLAPYAPKWLPGAWQHNQHDTVRARLYSGRAAHLFPQRRINGGRRLDDVRDETGINI